jgi:DNA-binding SARP family transcriptional activator
VEFRVLGPVEVLGEARPLPLGGPKERALLCALLLRVNRVVTTDQLVEELWSGRPTATAASAIRVYVSRLRRALVAEGSDPSVLQARAAGYVLTLEPETIDSHRFEQLVSAARAVLDLAPADAARAFREAVDLWRGPAYADVRDLDFAQAEATRLEELRLKALEDRIDAELAVGHHAAIVGDLQRLVDDNPLREHLTEQLMLALYRSGRQAEALRAYAATRRLLGDELGIEPGPALQALERAVLAQDEGLTWVPHPARGVLDTDALPLPPAIVGAARAELVGRRPELERLLATWETCAGGERRLVVIDGTPGIGKTRLSVELATEVHSRGAIVLLGRCDEDPPWAYQPFREALAHYVRSCPRERLAGDLGSMARDLVRLVPELAVRLPGLDEPMRADTETELYRLFEAVRALLAGATRTAPILLLLDDLQWADVPSLHLLQHLVRHPGGGALMVVATCRDDEGFASNGLDEVLSRLIREGLCDRLPLDGLDDSDLTELVRLSTPEEAQSSVLPTTASLLQVTEGNPFFVRELVRHLIETGSLETTHGPGMTLLRLPDELTKLLSHRLDRLSEPCRDSMKMASVIGREFDVPVLERVCEADLAQILAVVDEARRARVIVEVPTSVDRYRFAHALVRETAYASLGASRRARIHLRVAEALEAGGLHSASPAMLSHHFCAAAPVGGTRRAVDYARRAGDDALHQLAADEAVLHFERAVRVLRLETPVDRRELCGLVLRVGQARAQAGDRVGGRASIEEAAGLASELGEPRLLAQASLSVDSHGLSMGVVDLPLVAILEQALGELTSEDRGLRSRVLARLARELFFSGDAERIRELSVEALDEAESAGDAGAIAAALDARHLALLGPEHVGPRIEIATVAMNRAVEAREPPRELVARSELLVDLLEAGYIEEADEQISAHRVLAEQVRRPRDLWHSLVLQAMRTNLDGDLEESERLAAEALQLGDRLGMVDAEAIFALQLFAVRWQQGRVRELQGAVEDLVASSPGIPAWRCGLAMLYAEVGEADRARGQLDALAVDDFAGLPRDWLWLAAVTVSAQVSHTLGAVDEARALYRLLMPYAGRNVVVGAGFACLGSAARYLGLLATTMGKWADAEALFVDAIRMNDEMRAGPWAAQSRCDLATGLLQHAPDAADRSLVLAREALAMAQRFGMLQLVDQAREIVSRAEVATGMIESGPNG